MDALDDGGATAATAAEILILRWDSASSDEARDRMLFDGDHRAEAERYLRAVDEVRRVSLRESAASASATGSPRRSVSKSLQLAMARLEDEFRNILVSRVSAVEAEFLLSDLSSISISSSVDCSLERVDDAGSGAGGGGGSSRYQGEEYRGGEEEEEGGEGSGSLGRTDTSTSSGSRCYRSASGILEIDLVPPDAVRDLRSIAEQMIAAGYRRECFQAYSSVRKAAADHSLRQLGVEKLSIGDVQRLQWDALEAKIRRWIRAARACVRVVFASDRRLCDLVFDGIVGGSAAEGDLSLPDIPFAETVKGAALQLFGFAEAISIGKRSPEKLFKILDLHDALHNLLPDIEIVFLSSSSSSSESSIHTQVVDILSRLAEAARGILSEFENAVHQELSNTPVPGGTIHPLTRYVMNYISLISDYKPTLAQLIVSKPSTTNRATYPDAADEPAPPLPDFDFPEMEDQSPLSSHLIWIIAILEFNLENKAKLYKDAALSHLFIMNNVHYIVNKVKGSPELRELIGDEYLKRLMGKFRHAATNYQRAAWIKVLHCLRDEGIHVSGSFSSGISRGALRERFKSFNAAFEEVHRVQALWLVPDAQLKEELRISISERLLPAYRAFLGRYRQHIESGRHPEVYIKYSVEDLEIALEDFFQGFPPSQQSRKRYH